MRLLLIVASLGVVLAQNDIAKNIQTRAISEATNSGEKFKIYVGTIDGVRREIFNEVDGGQIEVAPDNTPNSADPFGAYDDSNVVSTDNEKVLFVPKPYRPGGDKKEPKTTKATTTVRPTTAPPTTIRTIPFVPTTRATFATLPPVTQAPIQPFQPRPIQTIAPSFNRPPPPTAPPRVLPPQQPFQPVQPIQPQQPFVQRPQQPFTRRPFVPQTRPAPVTAPTTAAPRQPFQKGQNLRTGQCPASIFYISTPITGPSRLTFTHFAVAVTVDQCARTCHEFNCAIAHYNPLNGHCEFNPSTAFAIRNGQCPAWPSLHYRNNVVANEPVRIFCVTCQRPRRRPTGRRPFRGQARRGQRLGRTAGATSSRSTVDSQRSSSTKQRKLRETSSERSDSAPSRGNRESQLDLLKQLEDLQL
ncbi:unnamed protein product [Caenorhabditis bovis]|uniref:Apple domain-containing protein n=1 Tax=Caenorhabditis bovis TaxID=2654633 RepID=A0A8S1EW23_9PELO|nr:unnamed protein product [Caenorhabditis bovis]